MNVHDSRRIEEQLLSLDYLPADSVQNADLILFNTCSVRDKAEQKVISAAGALQRLKAKKPNLIVVVAGCVAQQMGEGLPQKLDIIDLVIGPDNIPELPHLIRQIEMGSPPLVRTVFDLDDPHFLSAQKSVVASRVTEYVTVMKGCDKRCSYCIVPFTRGTERYRPAQHIIDEIRVLTHHGTKEVTLLGQTVNSWQEPAGSSTHTVSGFAGLLRKIGSEVPALKRLRYAAPHPQHLNDELMRAHTELELLPSHAHLPAQSGSDRILKRMIRRYTRQQFIEGALALKKSRPDFTLSTDIIVGFPGETEEDFEETLSLVREVGFVSVYAFKYSPRPFTSALRMEDTLSMSEKVERLARLFEVVDRQQETYLKSLVGTQTTVLVEGPNDKNPECYSGRSHRNEIVHIKVPPGIDLTGQLVDVTIEHANKHSLMATLDSETSRFELPHTSPALALETIH